MTQDRELSGRSVSDDVRLLFVSGLFRSGTTMLGNMLGLHPRVHMNWQPYGPFFRTVRNRFATAYDAGFDTGRPMGVDWLSSPALGERFRHVFEDVVFDAPALEGLCRELGAYLRQDDAGSVNEGLKPSVAADRLEELRPGSAGEVLEQLLVLLAPDDGTLICGCKEVFVEEFVEPLLHYFGGGCRCVHILRDPRAVAFSRNNGLFRRQIGTAYPLAFIAEAWNRSAALAAGHRSLEGVAVVQYEHLARTPEATLTALLDRIGLGQPGLEPLLRDGLSRMNASNSSFADAGRGISTRSIEKWKQDPAAAAYFETVCAEGMRELGYAPLFSDQVPPPLREDGSSFPGWLQSYYRPLDTMS